METLAVYLLKVNLVIPVLYLVYMLCLKKEKFFTVNRLVLIGILVVSFVLPFLPDLHSFSLSSMERFQDRMYSVNPFSGLYIRAHAPEKVSLPAQIITTTRDTAPGTFSGISLLRLFVILNMMVTLVLLLRFAIQLFRLFRLIRGSRKRWPDGILCYEHEKGISPFSFFHCLVINQALYSDEQYAQIILHETEHIRGWHSIDILLTELAHMFLWINPVVAAFKRSVKLNLEYIADDAVLRKGVDRKTYQMGLLQCVMPSPALVNLFNSSKLKNRIIMMNTGKTPARHLYKYVFVLPALFLSYFVIHPLKGRATVSGELKQNELNQPQWASAEGYYQDHQNKRSYILIREKNNQLLIRQLWNGKEFFVDPGSDVGFTDNLRVPGVNSSKLKPFEFITDKRGIVLQLFAKNRDLWNKINEYKPMMRTDTTLTPGQLKAFEGYYKMGDDNYIHIAAEENGIILKQMWDGREIHFTAQSALEFLDNDGNFPLKFTKGSDGTVTQVLAFNRDLWNRTDSYKPPVIKTVHLNQSQLKACAGKYKFRFNDDKNDSYIQIRVIENNLMLKQIWDGKEFMFVPQSPIEYCVKDDPRFTLKFIKDSNGVVTQVLAFNRDLWNRVKE